MHSVFITKDIKNHPELDVIIAYPLLSENDLFKKACNIIVSELDRYNAEKIGCLPKQKIYYNMGDSQIEIAEMCGTSMLLSNHIDHGVLERILNIEPELLNILAVKAKLNNVKNFYGWCYQDSFLVEVFKNAGFNPCGEFQDFTEDRVVQRFCWNLELMDMNTQIIKEGSIAISNEETYESYQELNPYFLDDRMLQDSFGIFVYSKKEQQIKGGVFGTIHHAAIKGIPHGDILCLWLDASLQGKGIGRFLMDEAEKLLKEQGVQYIQLATNGFQAPEFYEKCGFNLVESCPAYYMHTDYVYSIFDCTKKI